MAILLKNTNEVSLLKIEKKNSLELLQLAVGGNIEEVPGIIFNRETLQDTLLPQVAIQSLLSSDDEEFVLIVNDNLAYSDDGTDLKGQEDCNALSCILFNKILFGDVLIVGVPSEFN